jgi:hypothetical protein
MELHGYLETIQQQQHLGQEVEHLQIGLDQQGVQDQ